jgi:hypothetical protein
MRNVLFSLITQRLVKISCIIMENSALLKLRILSKVCSAGLGLQSIIPENDGKTVSIPVNPEHSKNSQFSVCMGEDSGRYAGCHQHSCQTCRKLERAYLQVVYGMRPTYSDTRAMLSGLRTEACRPSGFYTRQSLPHATGFHRWIAF